MRARLIERLCIVLAVVFVVAAGYGSVYVQSTTAKILKEPSFKADTVASVNKAAELELIEKKGRWYKVSYDGKTGWISSMVVGPRPPMQKLSIADKRRGDIGQYARRRASVVTATAAARGLTDDDRRRLGDRGTVDFDALERLESIEITESELNSFIEQTK